MLSFDDPAHAEMPPGFDWQTADSHFVAFAKYLNAVLRTECLFKSGVYIQDASFHGNIVLSPDLLKEKYTAGVRVSNFGNFCTVYDDDSVVKINALRAIKETTEDYGYVYLPTHVLDLPYTGINIGVTGFDSWGRRFFDWI